MPRINIHLEREKVNIVRKDALTFSQQIKEWWQSWFSSDDFHIHNDYGRVVVISIDSTIRTQVKERLKHLSNLYYAIIPYVDEEHKSAEMVVGPAFNPENWKMAPSLNVPMGMLASDFESTE